MSAERPRDDSHLRANDLDRSMAGTALDNAYADGELDNAEYHARLEAAGKAKTRGELYGLLDDLQVPHPLPELPAQPAPAQARPSGGAGRGRVIAGVVIAAVIAVIAIVIAVLPGRGSTSSKPVSVSYAPGTIAASTSPRADFTADDAALMLHLPAGYDQTNCYPDESHGDEIAALHCDPSSGHLEAAFFLYPDAETVRQNYDADRGSAAHTPCADGALDNPYATGRYECIMSNGAGVVPTIEWTAPQQNILATYFASGPNSAASLLNYWKQHNRLR